MNADACALDALIQESYRARKTPSSLKRSVIRAVQGALDLVPSDAAKPKCHHAVISMFLILRTLQICSVICRGTVSGLMGGVDSNGSMWQFEFGPSPQGQASVTEHEWLLTEFGEVVDLTCSHFYPTRHGPLPCEGTNDVIPVIWMKTEELNGIPKLCYDATAKIETVHLVLCDEVARHVISRALATFWAHESIAALLQASDMSHEARLLVDSPRPGDCELLSDWQSLKALSTTNSWVRRNSQADT